MTQVVSVKKKKLFDRIISCWQLYILVLPAFLYVIIFHYLPMYGIVIAFQNYNPASGFFSNWVGFKHFITFFKSVQFWKLIRNTLLINVYGLVFTFPLPILLALLLNEARFEWFKKTVQNITYIPLFVSTVVLVGMLNCFLSPSNGIINTFIEKLGGTPIDFMGNEAWFRSLYIISGTWQNCGNSAIIFIAALSGIDLSLHEAAQIDGANRLQRIIHVNIPGIMPTIVMILILSCGNMLSVGFDKVYLMQNTMNLSVSEVISTYTYKVGLLNAKYSYSTAIGLFNSVINFLILFGVDRFAHYTSEVSLF